MGRMMTGLFLNELIGALLQLLLFSLLPFITWLIFYRKKESFLKWIGLKKVEHAGKWQITIMAVIMATALYIGLMILAIKMLPDGLTTAGSGFAGKGIAAFPAVMVYGFIRTGLSEEILFRGFLLKRISERFGFVSADTIQALLFGLLHGIPFGLITDNVLVGVIMTLLPGAIGCFLGWLNEKRCAGSIVPSWLLHGFINVLTAAMSL